MPNNDACVGRSLLTSEVPKDRVMVISLMVGCRRTWAETGIVRMEKGSVRLVMLMINYVSAERLQWRWRRSWICDTERNTTGEYHQIFVAKKQLSRTYLLIAGTQGHSELRDGCLDIPKPQSIYCCHHPFWKWGGASLHAAGHCWACAIAFWH